MTNTNSYSLQPVWMTRKGWNAPVNVPAPRVIFAKGVELAVSGENVKIRTPEGGEGEMPLDRLYAVYQGGLTIWASDDCPTMRAPSGRDESQFWFNDKVVYSGDAAGALHFFKSDTPISFHYSIVRRVTDRVGASHPYLWENWDYDENGNKRSGR